MSETRVIDVSRLPTHAFGHRSLMWWGTLCLMLIEGTVFVMAIVSYFYLRGRVNQWGPSAVPPSLTWGSLNTAIMLFSVWPNEVVKKKAEHEDLPGTRWWLVICILVALAFLVVRVFEFGALHVNWDTNAYGSITWTLLGLHTTHLVTDFFDTCVLTVLMFISKPLERRRFVDVSENSFYWYFVVASWLPIYAVLYFAPRYL